MAIYRLDNFVPIVHRSAWVADSAQIIGNVELAEDANVWFGSVLRGDNARIRIGRRSNVQDCCMLHVDVGFPLDIGDGVSIGHQVTLHGCSIGDGTLVGMQAIILNGARIGRDCMVGAGALVTAGKEFPDGSLILGAPAKAVRTLTPEQIAEYRAAAPSYVEKVARYRTGLERIG